MAYERFPYTDYHDLNLDWTLQRVKELSNKVDGDIKEVIREQLADLFVDIVYTPSDQTITFTVEI